MYVAAAVCCCCCMLLFIWVLAMPLILAGVPRMVKVINLIVVKLDNFINSYCTIMEFLG